MTRGGSDFFAVLAGAAAVATLPLSLVAAIGVGWVAAAVVLALGWLVLVPMLASFSSTIDVPFGRGGGGDWDPEAVERWMDVADRADSGQEADASGPLETLRARYARGEIDEAEFERRLDALVATDEIPAWAVEDGAGTDLDAGDAEEGTGSDGAAAGEPATADDEEATHETDRLRERE